MYYFFSPRFQREQLAVHWREWMTTRTLQLYKSNRVYYSLERDTAGVSSSVVVVAVDSSIDDDTGMNDDNGNSDTIIPPNDNNSIVSTTTTTPRIDNPDQRITEDVRTFTAFSLQLFIKEFQ
jgi:ABC-type uncharacterized transport system fused permease/ATPase subunit